MEIPFSRVSRPAALLVDSQGAPVWPIGSDEDLIALQAILDVLGGRVREVARPSEARATLPVCGERVFAIGRSAVHGRLYAHLTGREFAGAGALDELSIGGPSVVVCALEDLTIELLERLSDTTSRLPTGVGVIAAPASELRRRALVSSASARPWPQFSRKRVMVSGRVRSRQDGERCIVGTGSNRADSRLALSLGAGLLVLEAHSDGFDAALPGPAALCEVACPGAQLAGSPPRCVRTGRCARHDLSLDEARADGYLVAPGEIAAGVFVWSTCFGVISGTAGFSVDWSLLGSLLANPRIGAVITSWNVAFIEGQHLTLYDTLDSGESAGTGVHRFNLTTTGAPMCLFGDPRIAIPTDQVGDATISKLFRKSAPIEPRRLADDQHAASAQVAMQSLSPPSLEFSRRLLQAHHLRTASNLRARTCMQRTADVAARALADIEAEPVAAYRRAFSAYLLQAGRIGGYWCHRPADGGRLETHSEGCSICDGPARRLLPGPLIGEYARYWLTCSSCLADIDAPLGIEGRLVLDGCAIRIEGIDAPPESTAGVLICGQESWDGEGWACSVAQLKEGFRPPGGLPDDMFQIFAHVVWDFDYVLLGRRIGQSASP